MEPQVHTPAPENPLEQWALLEIMGHERLAGRIEEVLVAGTKMLQVDVPATDKLPAFRRYLSPSSLFSITPVPEPVARIVAGNLQKTAVSGIAAYGYTQGQQLEMRTALGLPAPAPEPSPRAFNDDDEECPNCGNYTDRCVCL